MTDEQKEEIVTAVKNMLPSATEERIKSVLNLILIEIESYNTCGKEIDWKPFDGIITEVLYQSLKNEIEKAVTAVKRGDTSFNYANQSKDLHQHLNNYSELIKRLVGCDGEVVFF